MRRFRPSSGAVQALFKEGAVGTTSLEDFTHKLKKPRPAWMKVPAAVAYHPKALATYPPADITIECIGDLLRYDLPDLLAAGHAGTLKAVSEST